MGDGQVHEMFRADLHVHSKYSGGAKHLRFFRCRDCYSEPVDVYRTAKQRGMDLVTITDHDAIDGCLELLDRLGDLPDFIIGEEVSAYFPAFRHTVHIGVYGINEAQHDEIQKLRSNGEELVEYLRRNKIFHVLNHFFHDFSDGARIRRFIERMAELFDIFEIQNGSQRREHNAFIVELLRHTRNGTRPTRPTGIVGGSDAHTLRRIARTFTASPARAREEFLEDIRTGRTQVFGAHSSHLAMAADIYGVVLRYYPIVLSFGNGEFPFFLRLRNFALSVLAIPFLVVPYIAAARHSLIERERIGLFSRVFREERIQPAAMGTALEPEEP